MTQNTPYTPAADEPSVFSNTPGYISEQWGEWYTKQRAKAWEESRSQDPTQVDIKSVIPNFLLSFDSTMHEDGRKVMQQIMQQIHSEERPLLPLDRPAMFLEGTRTVSMAWVVDEMLRFDVSPETAILSAEEIKNQDGKTLSKQRIWKSWYDWFFILKDQDIQVRMIADRDLSSGQFHDFTGCVGNYSRTILISERVGDGGRIRQPVVTISEISGEIVGKFTNEATFNENDLCRLMHVLIPSAGYVLRE